jgi:hypothetical protein
MPATLGLEKQARDRKGLQQRHEKKQEIAGLQVKKPNE